MAVLIADKIDFRTKIVMKDKQGHFEMIKWSIYQENIPIIGTNASNNRLPSMWSTS